MPRTPDSVTGASTPVPSRRSQGIFDLNNQFSRNQYGYWPDTSYTTPSSSWTRPADWPTLPTLSTTDNKIAGLIAVNNDDSNFVAFTATGGNLSYTQIGIGITGWNSATSFTTGSVTLTAGRLYLLCTSNTSSASDMTSVTGNNSGVPTFTKKISTQYNSNLHRVSIWSAIPTTTYNGTLTFNFASTQSGVWFLYEVTGFSGTDPVLQVTSSTGTSTTPSITLPSALSGPSNAIFAVQSNATSTASAPSTEINEGSGTTHLQLLAQTNATTLSTTLASSVAWGMVAIEISGRNCTVDWGDGTVEVIASGTQANHQYTYSTLASSVTSRGYKTALIIATMSGAFTSFNFQVKHSQTGLNQYESRWLDIAIAGNNMSSLTIGGSAGGPVVLVNMLERVNIVSSSLTSYANLFANCKNLQDVTVNSYATAISHSAIINSSTTIDASSFTTSSVTLWPGKLYLLAVNNTHGTSASAISSITGTTASSSVATTVPNFTSKSTQLFNSNLNRISVWSVVPTERWTGTLTINYGGVTQTGILYSLSEFSNVNTTTNDGIIQAVTNTGTGTNPNVTLAATSKNSNTVFNIFGAAAAPTYTVGAGFTSIYTTSITTPTASMLSQYRTNALTLTDCTLNSSSIWAGIGIELNLDNTTSNIAITSTYQMFYGCWNLKSVPLFNTQNVTAMNQMFYNCYSLQTVPLFNTLNNTDSSTMFYSCYSIKTVPLFNTSNVTTMTSMFNSCYNLQSVPLFNTQNVTAMNNTFTNCYSLQTVPLFNTLNNTGMTQMFYNCYSLQSVPLFNTQNVTTMSNTFYNCYNLQTVPLFNTQNVTIMGYMFYNCFNLQTVPLFNTQNVTTMSYMFYNCYNLQSVPLFNTSNVTDMSNMLYSCQQLKTIPSFNTQNVATIPNFLSYCYSLTTLPTLDTSKCTQTLSLIDGNTNLQSLPALNFNSIAVSTNVPTLASLSSLSSSSIYNLRYSHSYTSDNLSKSALESIFDNLSSGVWSQTITIVSNWGAPTPVSLSGTTTSGSTTVTMASTSGLSTGMEITGTGISDAVNVTLQTSGNTITKTAHGLSNGTQVSFPSIVTTNASTSPLQLAARTSGNGVSTFTSTSGTYGPNIAYANGVWVAATSTGIWTSTNPTNNSSWTQRDSTTSMYSVAYGNGYWVAVGASGVMKYTSTADASTGWTTGSPNFGVSAIYSVAYGNGYWAAVGSGTLMSYKATDPTGTWTQISPGYQTASNYITYVNGYWLLNSSGNSGLSFGYRASSPNGSFTFVTNTVLNNNSTINQPTYATCSNYGNGVWIVGTNNGYATSTSITGPWTYTYLGATVFHIVYSNGYWLLTMSGANQLRYKAVGVNEVPTGNWTNVDARLGSSNAYYMVYDSSVSVPLVVTTNTTTLSTTTNNTTNLLMNTPYYVVNATTDTFQISDTLGGSAKTISADATGTMIYPTTITAINPNVSVTLSVPASASGAITTSSALLKRSKARLKGWTVSG